MNNNNSTVTEEGITAQVAERIAATKPEWASFDHSDIAASTPVNGLVDALWANASESDVGLLQTAYYREDTGEKVSEDPVQVQVWGGDPIRYTDSDKARQVAAELLAAADQLDLVTIPGARVIRWIYTPEITRVVIYHRICDGIDRGEIAIPLSPDGSNDIAGRFARQLSAMQPGEAYEHDFKLGAGFPKEHMIDTFIGVFTLKAKIVDSRAIVVEEAR